MTRPVPARSRAASAIVLSLVLLPGAAAAEQNPIAPGWARLSIFGQAASTTPVEGGASTFGEIVTTLAVQSATREASGAEYNVDLRLAGYPSMESRATRVSIANRSAGGVSRLVISRSPNSDMCSVRGMGVAVMVKTSTEWR